MECKIFQFSNQEKDLKQTLIDRMMLMIFGVKGDVLRLCENNTTYYILTYTKIKPIMKK
jgi:hypothetical protein